MKRVLFSLVALLMGTAAAVAQSADLEQALTAMDKAAASFQSAQADFVWNQYQKVVDETDMQKGVMYVRRDKKNTEMAAIISSPDNKHVLFTGGKVRVYQPKIEQVTEYDAGKNRSEFESFLVLGFGGRGHDLPKSFEVKFAGNEAVQGVNAAKLELTPKSQRVRGMFEKITLWIDPARGVSVQQRFDEPSGDYRLALYSNIQVNRKFGDDVFRLKTTGKTRVVKPQG